jgi:hypothetical protein
MLDVIHRESCDSIGGWIFDCPTARGIHGGARTFGASVEAAEHAARQHLSIEAGYPIDLNDAALQLRHLRARAARPVNELRLTVG